MSDSGESVEKTVGNVSVKEEVSVKLEKLGDTADIEGVKKEHVAECTDWVKKEGVAVNNDCIKKEDGTESVDGIKKEVMEDEAKHKGNLQETISKLEADIIRQVEFYFSDANLVRDKFLLDQIGKNDEGWVPFVVLLTFKRLAALTTDVDVIVDALHKSEEGLVEISEDRTQIRRHPERPIPKYNEQHRKEVQSRTAYAKGFPLDVEMSDLIDFFNPFNKVINIVMRKYLDKATKTYKFKGSVFVTFAKKEQCEEFIKKEKVEYKNTNLLRKWQEQYLEEKKEEYNKRKKKTKATPEPEETFDLPKGSVIHFEGCNESTSREGIRKVLEELGAEVAFIEYNKGEEFGYVRLHTENGASTLLETLEDNKIKVDDSVELTLRTLSENEEEEFLKKAVEQMKIRRNFLNRNKGKRKRKGEKSDNEPPIKK